MRVTSNPARHHIQVDSFLDEERALSLLFLLASSGGGRGRAFGTVLAHDRHIYGVVLPRRVGGLGECQFFRETTQLSVCGQGWLDIAEFFFQGTWP